MENKVTTSAVKGLIISLILVVFSLVTIYTGQMQNKALGFVPVVICIAGIIWACISYSNQMDHNVTFGNVFLHGFKVAMAITAIMAIYTLLMFTVIKPELVDMSIDEARKEMEKSGDSDSDMETGLSMLRRGFVPLMVTMIVLMYGIGGTVVALIGAAVAKKNPRPNPF